MSVFSYITPTEQQQQFLSRCEEKPNCWQCTTPEESICPLAAACLFNERRHGETPEQFEVRWETEFSTAINDYLTKQKA